MMGLYCTYANIMICVLIAPHSIVRLRLVLVGVPRNLKWKVLDFCMKSSKVWVYFGYVTH